MQEDTNEEHAGYRSCSATGGSYWLLIIDFHYYMWLRWRLEHVLRPVTAENLVIAKGSHVFLDTIISRVKTTLTAVFQCSTLIHLLSKLDYIMFYSRVNLTLQFNSKLIHLFFFSSISINTSASFHNLSMFWYFSHGLVRRFIYFFSLKGYFSGLSFCKELGGLGQHL